MKNIIFDLGGVISIGKPIYNEHDDIKKLYIDMRKDNINI